MDILNNNIKISLIMPVFNSEQYLDKTINSIINQTLDCFELIIIDDGSTDCSLNILQRYEKKDKRIKIIKQKNSGVSKSRNRGIDYSNGEYIGFVDADDIIEKNFLKKLYNQAKKKEYDISMTGYAIFYNDNQLKLKNYTEKLLNLDIEKKNDCFELLLESGLGINIWSKLYKKEMLLSNNIRFMEELNYDEDMFFSWQCILAAKSIIFDNKTRYFYRLSVSSATMKYHEDLYGKYKLAFNKMKKMAMENNFYDDGFINQINLNFARKIPVMVTMISRSKDSFRNKIKSIDKILNEEQLIEGNILNKKIIERKKIKNFWGDDFLKKKSTKILIKAYIFNLRINLGRRIKKFSKVK